MERKYGAWRHWWASPGKSSSPLQQMPTRQHLPWWALRTLIPDLIDGTQECRLMLTKLTKHRWIKKKESDFIIYSEQQKNQAHWMYQSASVWQWIPSLGKQITRGKRGEYESRASGVHYTGFQCKTAWGWLSCSLPRGYPPARPAGMPAATWQVLLVRQRFLRSHDNYSNSFSFALFWRQRKSSSEAELMLVVFLRCQNPQLDYGQI